MSKSIAWLPLLTANEVAERLRVSKSRAYELLHEHPETVSIGRSVRIPESALEDFLRRNEHASRSSVARPQRGREGPVRRPAAAANDAGREAQHDEQFVQVRNRLLASLKR